MDKKSKDVLLSHLNYLQKWALLKDREIEKKMTIKKK